MNGLYVFETHLHTSEVSDCARVPAREMIRMYADSGYAGVQITDHFLPGRYNNSRERKAFLRGYYDALDEGAKKNLVVLPSMEIRFANGLEDFLVLGMDETEIINDLPDDVCYLTPKAFHALCQERGWLFYQAHPFRPNMRIHPASWLDGIEVHNGNPRHNSHNDLASQYAKIYGLGILAGSDAHRMEDVAAAGIKVPNSSLSSKGLVSYLTQKKIPLLYKAKSS